MHATAQPPLYAVTRPAARWAAGTACVVALLTIASLDFAAGHGRSFTLLYLVPVSVAAWVFGRTGGSCATGLVTLAAAVVSASKGELASVVCWNAGMRLGVCVCFTALIGEVRELGLKPRALRRIGKLLGTGLGAALALVALAFLMDGRTTAGNATPAAPGGNGSAAAAATPLQDEALATSRTPPPPAPAGVSLAELGRLTTAAVRTSRPVLLGSRDPKGPSCVTVSRSGDLKGKAFNNPGDLNGGPGTTLATLSFFDRQHITTARADYEWLQTRLKTYLENTAGSNDIAGRISSALAEGSAKFADAAAGWTSFPQGLGPIGYADADNWPAYCLAALDRAVASQDLTATKHWSAELASAAYSLDDLHRWLALLAENQLGALRFQRDCEPMFAAADARGIKYDPAATLSQFPAGVLCLNGLGNYYEVERQAERLFSMPPDRIEEIALNRHLTPGSLWVTPGVRQAFLKVRGALSAGNQVTLDVAARTPFEHSYLINMLFRSWVTDESEELVAALKRFDAAHPAATVGELTGVMMYRGHSFAGLEWADRFRPELVAAGAAIPTTDTDAQALVKACRWTANFYRGPTTYGVTFTLREAIEQRMLDCVRSTDMIGAIFRNAGRPRFGNVRWCAETAGHSVAAYLGATADGRARTLTVDGLAPTDEPETWPDAYFHGHRWPAGMERNPTPYAVELYVRGIDSYVWAEGYVVRGPHAGRLTSAGIPYFPQRRQASETQVYDGPFPQ